MREREREIDREGRKERKYVIRVRERTTKKIENEKQREKDIKGEEEGAKRERERGRQRERGRKRECIEDERELAFYVLILFGNILCNFVFYNIFIMVIFGSSYKK